MLLGGALAAFGGVYPWIALPLVAGCVLLAVIAPPRLTADTRTFDLAAAAIVAAGCLQLVPVPRGLAGILSPARVRFADAVTLNDSQWLTLSVSPEDSLSALLLFAGAMLMYASARRVLETAGIRMACRAIAWMGLALACVAIAQRGALGGQVYGFWTPVDRGALPYGPFINRNHCATWLLMGIPICVGYLIARVRRDRMAGARHMSFPRHRSPNDLQLRGTVDGRTVWLAVAATAMVLALALSLSRSGIAAFAISSVVTLAATRSRLDSVRTVWVAAIVTLGAIAVAALADVGSVVNRFLDAIEVHRVGRLAIWQDTVAMARDFWLTGTGIGTYSTGMLLYQTGDRAYYYNQAHNELLQVLAEGGLLVSVPAAAGIAAFVGVARRRLSGDASGMFWIRAGAAAGLAAVAVQSLWETGLRIPANALLAAVLAAIVTHRPRAAAP